MKCRVLVILTSLFVFVTSHDLLLGNKSINQFLIYQTTAQYKALPFKKRVVKNVFYSGNAVINSITAYDNKRTNATAAVTVGGIGFTFVNIRLKSERGKELFYEIGIYS